MEGTVYHMHTVTAVAGDSAAGHSEGGGGGIGHNHTGRAVAGDSAAGHSEGAGFHKHTVIEVGDAAAVHVEGAGFHIHTDARRAIMGNLTLSSAIGNGECCAVDDRDYAVDRIVRDGLAIEAEHNVGIGLPGIADVHVISQVVLTCSRGQGCGRSPLSPPALCIIMAIAGAAGAAADTVLVGGGATGVSDGDSCRSRTIRIYNCIRAIINLDVTNADRIVLCGYS